MNTDPRTGGSGEILQRGEDGAKDGSLVRGADRVEDGRGRVATNLKVVMMDSTLVGAEK